jgi:hypothetical protein
MCCLGDATGGIALCASPALLSETKEFLLQKTKRKKRKTIGLWHGIEREVALASFADFGSAWLKRTWQREVGRKESWPRS